MSSRWPFRDSPYEVLGVRPTADERDIRRAYRELVMKHHPDRGGDPRAFRRIQEAYRFLSSGLGADRRSGQEPRDAAYQSALEEYQRTLREMYEATFRHQAAPARLMEVAEAIRPVAAEAERELGKRFRALRKFAKELSRF